MVYIWDGEEEKKEKVWKRGGEMGNIDNTYVGHSMHLKVSGQLLEFDKSPSALTLVGGTQVMGLP